MTMASGNPWHRSGTADPGSVGTNPERTLERGRATARRAVRAPVPTGGRGRRR